MREERSLVELPERDGILDPHAVDRMLITSHCELQRISEEFQHGRRVFGRRMLEIYIPYTVAIAGALFLRLVPSVDLRSMMMLGMIVLALMLSMESLLGWLRRRPSPIMMR